MILIAHRGNTNGPNQIFENDPNYIRAAIDAGYSVEVDVWVNDRGLWLGHDRVGHYIKDVSFFLDERIWCHAKNDRALDALLKIGAHCFWHESDQRTITSKGWVWTHPNSDIIDHMSVQMEADLSDPSKINPNAKAVCSDYVSRLRIA